MFHFTKTAPLLGFRAFLLSDYAKQIGFGGLIAVTLAWCLGAPAGRVLGSATVISADNTIIAALSGLGSPATIEALTWLSRAHGTAGVLALSALLAAGLARRGKTSFLPVLAAAVPVGLLLNAVFKLAVQRARPDTAFMAERLATFSFPSGHTAGAMLFYGCLAILLWPVCRTFMRRAALTGVAMTMVGLVAASRVMLGVHYPSDCAAAMVTASLWLMFCVASSRVFRA